MIVLVACTVLRLCVHRSICLVIAEARRRATLLRLCCADYEVALHRLETLKVRVRLVVGCSIRECVELRTCGRVRLDLGTGDCSSIFLLLTMCCSMSPSRFVTFRCTLQSVP